MVYFELGNFLGRSLFADRVARFAHLGLEIVPRGTFIIHLSSENSKSHFLKLKTIFNAENQLAMFGLME
jgi:hypothetical protein